MAFNSFSFIVFYPLIFLLYYLIPSKYLSVRNFFLLAVSYLLYYSFLPFFSLVLFGVTIISYLTAILIDRYHEFRKVIIILGVLASIIPLLVFKYYNFINDSVSGALNIIGLHIKLQGLNWAIPVGISFYTLQAIGYVMDVYKRRIQVENNLLAYALFLSFFPSLVSGPINKASLMLPQIKKKRVYFDYSMTVSGLKMVLWGMFMKVVVADRAGLYVDSIFDNYEIYSGLTCLVASIMYSIQIYCDFAGYSLIAMGVGKTMGFELTNNFERPYLSTSVGEFWKRWHISLSSWLKDYVYIPLGGNRCGKLNTYRNLLFTFVVSGLWHGASWSFLTWGITHAIWMILEKVFSECLSNKGRYVMVVKTLITFIFINFTWVLFRMPTLFDSSVVLSKIFSINTISDVEGPSFIIVIVALVVIIKDIIDEVLPNRIKLLNSPCPIIRWATYTLLVVIIMTQGVLDSGQFIYASF